MRRYCKSCLSITNRRGHARILPGPARYGRCRSAVISGGQRIGPFDRVASIGRCCGGTVVGAREGRDRAVVGDGVAEPADWPGDRSSPSDGLGSSPEVAAAVAGGGVPFAVAVVVA